jgi:hypothetical protein
VRQPLRQRRCLRCAAENENVHERL